MYEIHTKSNYTAIFKETKNFWTVVSNTKKVQTKFGNTLVPEQIILKIPSSWNETANNVTPVSIAITKKMGADKSP